MLQGELCLLHLLRLQMPQHALEVALPRSQGELRLLHRLHRLQVDQRLFQGE